MPKFTKSTTPQSGALRFVGDDLGPTALPDQLVTVTPDMIGYQDLFTFGSLDAPARVTYPGTFGRVAKVGRR